MSLLPEKYSEPVGKPAEILIGILSAFGGLIFLGYTAWFIYRTPLVRIFSKTRSFITVFILMTVVLGFSILAYKLLSGKANRERRLIGNFFLYLLGIVSMMASVLVALIIIHDNVAGVNFLNQMYYVAGMFLIGLGAILYANHRRRINIYDIDNAGNLKTNK